MARSDGQRCEIVLIRHGETVWNVEHRLQGQYQGPDESVLTPAGHDQVRAGLVAARLKLFATLQQGKPRSLYLWIYPSIPDPNSTGAAARPPL